MKKEKFEKIEKFALLLGILIIYTIFMINKYGWENGPLVSLTTWSFFVFCTPIADAGFLIDFPVRILTGLKMFYSEMIVWVVAFLITTFALYAHSDIFQDTGILNIYFHILNNLNPFGIIIALSCLGTFLSVKFGDEIYDKISKKDFKSLNIKKYLSFATVFVVVIFVYYIMISQFNLKISLF